MFLSSQAPEDGLHELDFRFELRAGGEEFLFAHHGLNLCELADAIDLSCIGSCFYKDKVMVGSLTPPARGVQS
jgi:hypothetical protein